MKFTTLMNLLRYASVFMTYETSPAEELAAQTGLRARADKLELLFRQSFPALFVSILVALLLCWIFLGHADSTLLVGWVTLLFVSTLFRLALFVSYFRVKPTGMDLLRWEKPYITTLMLSSLIWGGGALVLLMGAPLLLQAFTLVVLIGLAGGAISTYSAQRFMAIAAMLAILLPSTVWLLFQPEKVQLGMAIGAIIFMAASLRATKILGEAMRHSFQLAHELRKAHDTADFLAKTDVLTGINNRRAFLEHGKQLINYCQRHEHQVCAILFDVDRFKDINDKHGHGAGDAALKQVGDLLRVLLRKSDVCGRIGGEEFAILLHPTSTEDGWAVAEKLRQAIAEMPITFHGQKLRITVSVGVACGAYDLENLLLKADSAMYRAKEEGRNKVAHHNDADGG